MLMMSVTVGSLKDEQALLTARDRLLTQPFSPTFTHPIFGDSEQVKGYKDLRIEVRSSISTVENGI